MLQQDRNKVLARQIHEGLKKDHIKNKCYLYLSINPPCNSWQLPMQLLHKINRYFDTHLQNFFV